MNAFAAIPVLEEAIEQHHLKDEYSPSDFDGQPSSETFGPLEWLVIAIGKRDGVLTFRSRSLLEAVGRLFAYQPNQLAKLRLEELRRMAALASERGWQVPASEMASFLRAGWSEDQLELLIENVSRAVAHERAPEQAPIDSTHTLPSYCS